MAKSTPLLVTCTHCGLTFSINKAECVKNYRKVHGPNGMKKRILELSKRAKD